MAAAPVSIPSKLDTAMDAGSGVDTAHDLSPTSPVDRQRMERMMANRPAPNELKDKNILKALTAGAPNDHLAGRRASLERSMQCDRLDKDILNRPTADELVKKGILNPNQTSPHQ